MVSVQSWSDTSHGQRPVMVRDQSWSETSHGQRSGHGLRVQSWSEIRHGQRRVMVRDQSWSETSHGQRPGMVGDQSWSESIHGQSPMMVKDFLVSDVNLHYFLRSSGEHFFLFPICDRPCWDLTTFLLSPVVFQHTVLRVKCTV